MSDQVGTTTGKGSVGLFVFGIIWSVFLGLPILFAMSRFANLSDLWSLLIMIPLLSVGVFCIYSPLAGMLNETIMRIDPHEISVKHGPLPMPGNFRMSRRSIRKLFCSWSSRESGSSAISNTKYSYAIQAEVSANNRVALLKKISNPRHALYISQLVGDIIGLEDRGASTNADA
jgi:hypothetical protein